MSAEERSNKLYDGVTPKFGILVDGKNYIVKYTYGNKSIVYSEYVASRFIHSLGVPCQKVWLGYYGKKPAVIIEDFTDEQNKLVKYKSTKQSSEDTNIQGKEYTYLDVLYMIKQHTKMNPELKKYAIDRFWQMFVCDALLGNYDRNKGNWGYLATEKGYIFSPLFDNGGCLFPRLDSMLDDFCKNERKILEECLDKPTSKFAYDDYSCNDKSVKERYYSYKQLIGLINEPLLFSHIRRLQKIGINAIAKKIIKITQILPIEYARFYQMVLIMRYLYLFENIPRKEVYVVAREVLKII